MKSAKKVALLIGIAFTSFSTIVSADTLYQVKGKSMYPTLKEGDVIQKVSPTYKEGDLVVAKVKSTGETIVKRYTDGKLIGDGQKSTNYRVDEVTVLGKVKVTKNDNDTGSVLNVANASTELGVDSPIKEAYAGDEFAMFLHEDTSITGFGSNVNNVLGISGGETKNTGELIKVSGPTGYEYLRAKRASAYGFRPLPENPSLYEWEKINTSKTKVVTTPVKEADDSARAAPGINDHDGRAYIDSTGQLWMAGSDYWTHLGIGIGNPHGKYLGYKWVRALDPKADSLITQISNEDNATPNIISESTLFSANTDISIEVNYRNMVNGIDNTSLKIEVLKEDGSVYFSKVDPYKIVSSETYPTKVSVPIENMPNGNYKIRITSSNTKFDIKVKERFYFKNAKKVLFASDTNGRFSAIDSEDNVYLHTSGMGILKKVNFPDGVHIKPETMVAGDGYHFAAIDDLGRIWTWETVTPVLVNFPAVNGEPFYGNYEVVKASVGYQFTMAIVREKATGITTAYVWGSNTMGKLGLESTASKINTPTLVTRKGVPLENIQTLAAGGEFSVIVQNTDDGQLIWTAGQNNKGQLGGGVQLEVKEPQLVPGLSNVKKLFIQNTPQVLAQTDNKMYIFGGTISYPKEFQMPYGLAMPDKWDQVGNSYWREDWMTSPTDASLLITQGDRVPYGFGGDYAGGRGSQADWKPIRIADQFVGNESLGREPGDYYFKDITDGVKTSFSGSIIDENNRLWGWGQYPHTGTGLNQVNVYNVTGTPFYTKYAHPSTLPNEEYAPAIFKSLAGEDNYGYAMSNDGKLWTISKYVQPVSSSWAINNVVIKNIYGSIINRFAAVDTNGEIWFTSSISAQPVKIPKSKYNNMKVVDVSNGKTHTIFVTEDGSVWAFGEGAQGKLGNGSYENVSQNDPVKVKNIKGAVSVVAGNDFSLALDDKGRVWSWGYAAYGSLGNNFSLTRSIISTAYGNELPEMTIENNIEDIYLSTSGNKEFKLFGTTTEKEKEKVSITASVLGVEKKAEVLNDAWEMDVYEQVKPVNWEIKWNANDFDSSGVFQSITKVNAEDERGGLIEQYYSGKIIVDNEKPQAPQWGDTCIVDKVSGETCYQPNYFKESGTNGVNKPVRIYMKPIQKEGEYKASVGIQMQYRIKQAYGYPPKWSDWIDVTEKNEKGYYYDFYQGFLGETQIKIRAKDEAGNTSDENSEFSYSIITNAGAEIDTLTAEANSVDNKLSTKLNFTAKQIANSTLKTFGVYRREIGTDSWKNLTPDRELWEKVGGEDFTDEDASLLGNKEYEYKVNGENSVAIGSDKTVKVITYPYEPVNLIRKVNETGIKFTVKQDERNVGNIKYKLVLIDNKTGGIYTVSKSSHNMKEEVIYDVKEGDAPFSVTNNSLTIKLLVQGDNKKFLTIVYDDNFENSPSVMEDSTPPEVYVGVEGDVEKVIDNQVNLVNLTFSATDDVSPNNKLQVQFSPDGTNWYGQKDDGTWLQNTWSSYKTTYTGFKMGSTVGSRIIYAKVKDEAGNVGTANVPLLIAQLVERDDNAYVVDIDHNVKSQDTLNDQIHLNNAYIYLNVPKTGNMKEVQYSFDGVKWSPWEKLSEDNNKKFINLPSYEGEHTIMLRYRNEVGDITRLKEDYDIIKYVLDKENPELQVETTNGTYIVKNDTVTLLLTPLDNLAKKVKIKFTNNQYQYYVSTNQAQEFTLDNNIKQPIFIKGLQPGFNIINMEVTDMAGNKTSKNVRVFRK